MARGELFYLLSCLWGDRPECDIIYSESNHTDSWQKLGFSGQLMYLLCTKKVCITKTDGPPVMHPERRAGQPVTRKLLGRLR